MDLGKIASLMFATAAFGFVTSGVDQQARMELRRPIPAGKTTSPIYAIKKNYMEEYEESMENGLDTEPHNPRNHYDNSRAHSETPLHHRRAPNAHKLYREPVKQV